MIKLKQMINLLQRETLFILEKSKKRYIFLLGIIMFYIFINLNQIRVYSEILGEKSIGDFIFHLFRGAENSINIRDIEFPVFWFLVNIFIIIIIGDSIRDDFKKNGSYILTRTSRKMFFVSKVISIIFNVIVYYGVIFITAIIAGSSTLKYEKYFYYEGGQIETWKLIIVVMILYVITSITILGVYTFLNLMMDEKYAILIISILLILSVYINKNMLLGSSSMIARQFNLIRDNLNIGTLVIYNIFFTGISFIGGIILINKKDIL